MLLNLTDDTLAGDLTGPAWVGRSETVGSACSLRGDLSDLSGVMKRRRVRENAMSPDRIVRGSQLLAVYSPIAGRGTGGGTPL